MSIGQRFVLCVRSGATIFPKTPPWFQNLVLNKKLSCDAFCATLFQNAQGRVWFHAVASFCSRKNSCSRMYKDVHP